MDIDAEKRSLRGLFLKKRESTSFDFIRIASKRIHQRARGMDALRNSASTGAYYPAGGEVLTQDIIQEMLSSGRDVSLPRITGDAMEFRRIAGFASLEKGRFDIMEPKEGCPAAGPLDAVLVPAVAVSPSGARLGHGHGFYDRFLAGTGAVSIALAFEKQIARNIPMSESDVAVDWIVTEDRVIRARP